MKIETKYDLGDTLWGIIDDDARPVCISEIAVNAVSARSYRPAGTIIIYWGCDDRSWYEDELFSTKEEAQAERDRRNRSDGRHLPTNADSMEEGMNNENKV